ncbi:hypothetical protein ANN_06753 [Periplaneta americana]|uniref:Transposase n=1 Tax=Periplaneta americana TaxID=6978 RepID=A0ABQ8TEJ3_PERAM|nr:hypothetical protein ANN_06753 [Periplaneta americana]
MSPGSSTESYPAFARIGLRRKPRKKPQPGTCPDRDSNPGHLVSRPDALTVTPQSSSFTEGTSIARAKEFNRESVNQFSNLLEKTVTANTVSIVDESGFTTVQKRQQKVIAQKEKHQVGAISGEKGVSTTVVCVVNAAGSLYCHW